MPSVSYGQTQQAVQAQRQFLLQRQIQSMRLLAMGSQDLSAEIKKVVAENPALEIVENTKPFSADGTPRTRLPYDNTRVANVGAAGEAAAQQFHEAFENAADAHETLQAHLLFQLNVMKLSPDEHALGEALIRNLDQNGWHILAPETLLDKSRPLQTPAMLKKLINAIRRMDPEGCCCANMEESLFVQAQIKGDAPPLALFILDGHIDVLYSRDSSPDIERIRKKIINLLKAREKLSFANEAQIVADQTMKPLSTRDVTEVSVREAIAFISRLNPRPAQGYGSDVTHYVRADIIVEHIEGDAPNSFASDANMTKDETFVPCAKAGAYFRIRLAPGVLPDVRIVPGLDAKKTKREKKSEQVGGGKFSETTRGGKSTTAERGDSMKKNINAARAFLGALAYRKSFILQAAAIIVKTQTRFFESRGQSFLEPLTQNDLAAKLDVHESTVSRMANEKFMRSPWSQLFPVKYFFTNAQDKIKYALQEIINSGEGAEQGVAQGTEQDEAANGETSGGRDDKSKTLSDRELVEKLKARGINVARRTVAKYRKQLAIASSYGRMAGVRSQTSGIRSQKTEVNEERHL